MLCFVLVVFLCFVSLLENSSSEKRQSHSCVFEYVCVDALALATVTRRASRRNQLMARARAATLSPADVDALAVLNACAVSQNCLVSQS